MHGFIAPSSKTSGGVRHMRVQSLRQHQRHVPRMRYGGGGEDADMRRKLFNFVSGASLMLCVATVVLWVLRWYPLFIGNDETTGSLMLYREGWRYTHTVANSFPAWDVYWRGFEIHVAGIWGGTTVIGDILVVEMPHIFVVGVLALLPIISAVMWWRRGGRKSGCCFACGYELTGNVSGVCPECGAPISQTSRPV
jgi:hypothetical protein